MAATNDGYLTGEYGIVSGEYVYLSNNTFTVSSRDYTSEEECFDDNCVRCRDGLHGFKTKVDAAAFRNGFASTWTTKTFDYLLFEPLAQAAEVIEFQPKQYKVKYADGAWEAVMNDQK